MFCPSSKGIKKTGPVPKPSCQSQQHLRSSDKETFLTGPLKYAIEVEFKYFGKKSKNTVSSTTTHRRTWYTDTRFSKPAQPKCHCVSSERTHMSEGTITFLTWVGDVVQAQGNSSFSALRLQSSLCS